MLTPNLTKWVSKILKPLTLSLSEREIFRSLFGDKLNQNFCLISEISFHKPRNVITNKVVHSNCLNRLM